LTKTVKISHIDHLVIKKLCHHGPCRSLIVNLFCFDS
jgi:hypothetical protein